MVATRSTEIAKYVKAYKSHHYFMRPWRQHILRSSLKTYFQQGSQSYLDVGCGRGESIEIGLSLGLVSRGCEVVSSLCGNLVDHIDGAHSLPYSNRQFDIVSCNDVMEHLLDEDVGPALQEMWRVCNRIVILGISCKPAKLHITIKSPEEWHQVVSQYMDSVEVVDHKIPPIKRPYVWLEAARE